jgi:mannosyltransferase
MQRTARNSSREGKNAWVFLTLFCALGLAIRLLGIAAESFTLDEATSLIIARMPILKIFSYLQKSDVHPPLYFLLLHFWRIGGEGTSFLRLLSALVGVLTIPATYFLGRRLFNQEIALVTSLLVGLAPLHIYYSQITRGYSLLILLTVLSFLFLLRATDLDTPLSWAIYIICALASLLTHYYALLALFFQNLMAVVFILFPKKSRNSWRNWGLANILASVLFFAWLSQSAVLTQNLTPLWLSAEPKPTLESLITPIIKFSLGPVSWSFPSWALRVSGAVFLLILVLAPIKREARWPFFNPGISPSAAIVWGYFLLPLLAAWIISQEKNIYALRYLSPFLIPFLLLLGVGISKITPKWLRALAAGAVISIFLSGAWLTYRTVQHTDWRVASSYLIRSALPGDIVVVSPPWYQKVLDYYARGRIAYYRASDSEPDQICRDAAMNHSRLWLVEVEIRHWQERSDRLRSCLDSQFQKIRQSGFEPGGGKISLYLTNQIRPLGPTQ